MIKNRANSCPGRESGIAREKLGLGLPCAVSSMVEHLPSKQRTSVRFRYGAPFLPPMTTPDLSKGE